MPTLTPRSNLKVSKRSLGASKKCPLSLQLTKQLGLIDGPKTTRLNAKVSPRLFAAAARRAGSTSPAVVITAALAALATEDELGPWLAQQWGSLAGLDPQTLAQLDL